MPLTRKNSRVSDLSNDSKICSPSTVFYFSFSHFTPARNQIFSGRTRCEFISLQLLTLHQPYHLICHQRNNLDYSKLLVDEKTIQFAKQRVLGKQCTPPDWWYWGCWPSPLAARLMSHRGLDYGLLLFVERHQVVGKGGVFHCHFPIRYSGRFIFPWDHTLWCFKGDFLLHQAKFQQAGWCGCVGSGRNANILLAWNWIRFVGDLRKLQQVQQRLCQVNVTIPYSMLQRNIMLITK